MNDKHCPICGSKLTKVINRHEFVCFACGFHMDFIKEDLPMNEQKEKKTISIKTWIIIGVAALLALFVLLNCFTIVKAGHTGVTLTMGKVQEGVLEEGLHLKVPFVQRIVKVDNRIQKLEVETEAFSKDLQSVETVLAINFRVDAAKSNSLYKNVGKNYGSVLIIPSVNEVLKAITSKYTAEESVTNRVLISDGLVEGLNEKLIKNGLYVTDVNIVNFDFSDAFINAIEEKQVAQQKLLKAETEKKTAITNAKAKAESLRIAADAEAEANKKIAASLTGQIIENKKVEKWDGKLPTYMLGENGTMIELK